MVENILGTIEALHKYTSHVHSFFDNYSEELTAQQWDFEENILFFNFIGLLLD